MPFRRIDGELLVRKQKVSERLMIDTIGIGGRSTPTRFIYQTKFALFVEEAANRQAFADLVGRTCGATGARVVGP